VGALVAAAMAALAIGAARADASSFALATSEPSPTDDHYNPANSSVTASSTNIAFGIPAWHPSSRGPARAP
jgi:hypothetical protein